MNLLRKYMRHYFIVNLPRQKDSTQMICDILNNSSIQTDAEVLITQKLRDAVRIVKDICLKNPNPKRFGLVVVTVPWAKY